MFLRKKCSTNKKYYTPESILVGSIFPKVFSQDI